MGLAYFHIFIESNSNSITAKGVIQLTERPVLGPTFRAAVKSFCKDKSHLKYEMLIKREDNIINELRAYPTKHQAIKAREDRDEWRNEYFKLRIETHELH